MDQRASVTLGGDLLNDAILTRVEVRQRLNDHWYCDITCRDTLGYPVPAEDALGQELVLTNLAEDGSTQVVFVGTVIEAERKVETWGSYSAKLRAASSSWLLDQSENFALFSTGDVSAVASALAPGASCSLKARRSPTQYVQFAETNWQFLLRLADDHLGWIRAGLGSIELRDSFDAAHTLTFREEQGLLEFHIDGELGPAQMASAHVDPAIYTSQVAADSQQTPTYEQPGQRMGSAVASGAAAQGLAGFSARSRSLTGPEMLTQAQADAERALGGGVLAGGVSRDSALTAGSAIDVANLGEASGTYYLLGVTHLWTQQEYINHFTATPWKNWRAPERPRPHRATGVQPARVVANHDPEQRGRLEVSLYWQEAGSLEWAPMATQHSGSFFGLTFIPEIGDEVLVDFLDGDPERPVILGSLWNGVHQPPRQAYIDQQAELGDNLVKRLVTKSGIRLHIVDTPGQESLLLATPRANQILLSEKVAETGRPMVALHTQGDILLQAAGRIHQNAAFYSRHVDGKVMHTAQVSLTDRSGNSTPYEDTGVKIALTDGSTYEGPVQSGQLFSAIPPGQNQVKATDVYPPRTTPRTSRGSA